MTTAMQVEIGTTRITYLSVLPMACENLGSLKTVW